MSARVGGCQLEIEPLGTYISRLLLRWVGYVSRMPMFRAPRKLLTSWASKPRPARGPQMTWGWALTKALNAAGVPSALRLHQVEGPRCPQGPEAGPLWGQVKRGSALQSNEAP